MSNKQFFNNLSATYADVRKLNAKKIFLGGENILDIINSSTPTIKHANDTRTTITEDDLWGQWVETTSDGTIIIHDEWVTNPNSGAWNTSITKVEDNKAYIGDTLFANIQTEKLVNGHNMFYYCELLDSFSSDLSSLTNGKSMFSYTSISSFTSDLSSLTNGEDMFSCHGTGKIEYFESNLSSLTNGNRMFTDCSKLTTFKCGDLSSLTDGVYMFQNCTNLTTFTSNLSSLTNGTYMFYGCSNLTTFAGDLSSLTDGTYMFRNCSNLTTFTSDLSSLTNGANMFNYCSNLTNFTSDLSSLTSGYYMFYHCSNLTNFTSDLSSLTNGLYMFSDCTNLTTFTSDLSSLTNGTNMFADCTSLTTFTSVLSSLTSGYYMFYKTNLSPQSVMFIADSIKDIDAEKKLYQNGTIPYVTLSNDVYSSTKGFMSDGKYVYTYNNPKPYTTTISASIVGSLTIGINVTNKSSTIKQQLQTFAEEATFDSWADLKQFFVDKGWNVTWQYGGTTTTIPNTYDMRGERAIPCPIFAQLEEVEDKERAEYTNEEGTKFYNINWGHDVTNYDDFQQFDSLEDAMASWNVFPKENIITTEE